MTKKLMGLFLTLLVLCTMRLPSLTFAADNYPYPNECTSCADPWGFWYRQCTSYVAWRMNRDAGTTENPYSFHNYMRAPSSIKWTHAGHWADHARDLGIEVNNTPAVGAIAHWDFYEEGVGKHGHVAYVEAVNPDGSVNISEYNKSPYSYSTRNIQGSPRYIHVHSNFMAALPSDGIDSGIVRVTGREGLFGSEKGSVSVVAPFGLPSDPASDHQLGQF